MSNFFKNLKKSSVKSRLIIAAALVFVIGFSLVQVGDNSEDLQGRLSFNNNANAGYTLEECMRYKDIWDSRDWTREVTRALDKPAACARLYPDFWYHGVTMEVCRALSDDWNEGNFSARGGDGSQMAACQRAGYDYRLPEPEALGYQLCEVLVENYFARDWSYRNGVNSRQVEECITLYPNDLYPLETEELCTEAREIWDSIGGENAWLDRFGDLYLPNRCEQTQLHIWNPPTKKRCSNISDLWNAGDFTRRNPEALREASACFRLGWDWRINN